MFFYFPITIFCLFFEQRKGLFQLISVFSGGLAGNFQQDDAFLRLFQRVFRGGPVFGAGFLL
jgi:hypothetical protein